MSLFVGGGDEAGRRPRSELSVDVFELRRRVVDDYQQYVTSFISIRDPLIQAEVDKNLDAGLLWPEPRIGLNPSFETGGLIDEHVDSGLLHGECSKIF